MKNPFKLPLDISYNRSRPISAFLFGLAFLIWKLVQNFDESLSETLLSPFTWILPVILFFTAWKMWNRIIIRIEEKDIWVYPLFGPGERRYSYAGFDKLVIMQGRLYIVKKDPDNDEDRGVFVIAGWALDKKVWVDLANYLKLLHGVSEESSLEV